MHSTVLAVGLLAETVVALNNGVGKLPPLGYNTFNAFGWNYDASIVLAQAQAMQEHGLVDLGYNRLILDDAYIELERNATGHMVANLTKFPGGLETLSEQMQQYGVRLAAYGDSGYFTCGGFPGSYGHELQDLETWHSWGMDYLKFDNCYAPPDNITQQNIYGRYRRMSDAIEQFAAQSGTTIELGLCEWGLEQPWVWARQLGQHWRVTNDIKPFWEPIAQILTQASYHYWATDFYGHNDLDIMEVGNVGQGVPPGNLTFDESKAHFTAWALLKSPIFIGADLTNQPAETWEILGNKDLIRIHQDPNEGRGVSPFRWGTNEHVTGNPNYPQTYWPSDPFSFAQYWSGNSSYGVVIMLLNPEDQPQTMSFDLVESWLLRAGRQYSVYDMWQHEDIGVAQRTISMDVPAHGVAALLLNDAGPEPASLDGTCANQYFCGWPNGSLVYPF